MQNLERRLNDLERANSKSHINLFVHFDSPLTSASEILHLTDQMGNEWKRLHGEPESEFKARAVAGATRSHYGVVMLYSEI